MTTTKEYRMVPVTAIYPHPNNPRTDLGDPQKLAELANDLAENGNTIPLRLFPNPDGKTFLAIEGHRRTAAAKLGNVEELYCWIDPAVNTLAKQIEAMLRENTHREGITTENEAKAIQTLLDCEGMSVRKVAKSIHRSETFIRQRSQIAKLPDRARGLIDGGQLTLEQSAAFDEFRDDTDAIEKLTYVAQDRYSNKHDFERQVLNLRMRRDQPMHAAESERVIREFKVPTLTENQTYSGHYHSVHQGDQTDEQLAKAGHFARIAAGSGKISWYKKVSGADTKRPATEEEIAERKRLKDLEAGLEQDLALWDEHLRRSIAEAGGGLPLTAAEKRVQAGMAACVLRHHGDYARATELLIEGDYSADKVSAAVNKLRPLQLAMLMVELHIKPEKLHKPGTWELESWSVGANQRINNWIQARRDVFGYEPAVFEQETIDHFAAAGESVPDEEDEESFGDE